MRFDFHTASSSGFKKFLSGIGMALFREFEWECSVSFGTDATHFRPMGICNRAQVVTFLCRAFGDPCDSASENPFRDVPAGQWYTAPVLWAVEKGITNGLTADVFGPNANCNRAQTVTFLYRAYC